MIYIILTICAVAALIGYVLWQKKKRGAEVVNEIFGFDIPAEPRYALRTDAGVTVRSQRPISSETHGEMLDAIDNGISRFLVSTDTFGWTLRRAYADYEVWLLEPTSESDPEGYPTLNMKNGQKIAGIAVGVQNIILDNPFICVAYNEAYPHWLTRSTRNEAEHIGAFGNVSENEWARNTASWHSHPLYPFHNEFAQAVRGHTEHFNCGVTRG